MKDEPTMKHEAGSKADASTASLGDTAGAPHPQNIVGGGTEQGSVGPQPECSDYGIHGTGPAGHPEPTEAGGPASPEATGQEWQEAGYTGVGGFGSQPGGGAGAREAASKTQAGPIPGPDPWKMGSQPGAGPFHGACHHNQELAGHPPYGHPPYGPPTGGSHPWDYPGMGHHPGCFAHQGQIYGYEAFNPYFGGPTGPGVGYPGPPHPSPGAGPHYGPFADVVGKALQGQATPHDLINGLLSLQFRDDQFWKGVLVGSAAALLLNSDSLRKKLAGALGQIFGQGDKTAEADAQSTEKPPPDEKKAE